MLTEPLPSLLDMRKMASRGTQLKGVLGLANLPRITDLLADSEGQVEVNCSFLNDEEGRHVLSIQFETELSVVCQRCMEPMGISVNSSSELGIVWSEDHASELPSHLEPLVLGEEQGDLWSAVEDELILSLPIVSYHETGTCVELIKQYSVVDVTADLKSEPSPFQILKKLKLEK